MTAFVKDIKYFDQVLGLGCGTTIHLQSITRSTIKTVQQKLKHRKTL